MVFFVCVCLLLFCWVFCLFVFGGFSGIFCGGWCCFVLFFWGGGGGWLGRWMGCNGFLFFIFYYI